LETTEIVVDDNAIFSQTRKQIQRKKIKIIIDRHGHTEDSHCKLPALVLVPGLGLEPEPWLAPASAHVQRLAELVLEGADCAARISAWWAWHTVASPAVVAAAAAVVVEAAAAVVDVGGDAGR